MDLRTQAGSRGQRSHFVRQEPRRGVIAVVSGIAKRAPCMQARVREQLGSYSLGGTLTAEMKDGA